MNVSSVSKRKRRSKNKKRVEKIKKHEARNPKVSLEYTIRV